MTEMQCCIKCKGTLRNATTESKDMAEAIKAGYQRKDAPYQHETTCKETGYIYYNARD